MNKNELIEKIKKLLALSDSSNPNEAAVALSRAQKLMEKYKIETAELQLNNGIDEIQLKTLNSINTQTIMCKLLNIIRKAFGVEYILHTTNSKVTSISLIGPSDLLESCEYIFSVLSRQAAKAIGDYTKIIDGEIYYEMMHNQSFLNELQNKVPDFYMMVFDLQKNIVDKLEAEDLLRTDEESQKGKYEFLAKMFKESRNVGYAFISQGYARSLKGIFSSMTKEKKLGFIQGYFNSINEKIAEYAQPFEIQESIEKFISEKHPALEQTRSRSSYNTMAGFQAYQKGLNEGKKVTLNSAIKDHAPKMASIGLN
jgi:hypothetical protein